MKYNISNSEFGSVDLLRFAEAEKAFAAQLSKAYNEKREELLRKAILKLEDGRMPEPDEIRKRGHRVVFPCGKILIYWDSTPIFMERDSFALPQKPMEVEYK